MNTIQHVKTFAVMIAICLPTAALPQEFNGRGWYAGGGVSLNDVYSYEEFCYYCYGSSTYGDSDIGAVLTGGYRMTDFFAVETTYSAESAMRWRKPAAAFATLPGLYGLDSVVSVSSFQVAGLAILSGRLWEGYLRLGLAMWEATAEQRLAQFGTGEVFSRVVNSDGDGFLFGVGVGRRLGTNWKVRVDYVTYQIDAELMGVEEPETAYTDYLALQFLYGFGPGRD